MAGLTSLSDELLILIIKELITPDEREGVKLDRYFTYLRPVHYAILQTCKALHDLGIQHYHDCTELAVLDLWSGFADTADNRRLDTKIMVDYVEDVKSILRDQSPLFPKFQRLKLDGFKCLSIDMTDYDLIERVEFYSDDHVLIKEMEVPPLPKRTVSWRALQSDPTKIFSQVASLVHPVARDLANNDCRVLSYHLDFNKLNFIVKCDFVPCLTRPTVEHLLCATLFLSEFLPTHLLRPATWYADEELYNGADCECAAKILEAATVETPAEDGDDI